MSFDSPRDGSVLAFRVLRLKPVLQVDTPVKVDLGRDMREGVDNTLFPEERAQLVPEEAFAGRVECKQPSDLWGVQGFIDLPRSIGQVYLGENFSCCVSLSNNSNQVVSAVGIKAEMQSERSRAVLFDNLSSPLPVFAPGARREFTVQHDIKELGAHTLICSTEFTSTDGNRRYVPQYFRFTALSPLSMRTKVRAVGDVTYLEACLENSMTSPLILDYVRFDPTERYKVTLVEAGEKLVESGPLRDYINQTKIVHPDKGTRNFMFRFDLADPNAPPTDDSRVLGKMEIKWRSCLGEMGRLQTQQILSRGAGSSQQDISGKVVSVPDCVKVFQPFEVEIKLQNTTKRALGPLSVVLDSGDTPENDVPIVMHGIQSINVDPLPPAASYTFSVKLVALEPGVQSIIGLKVVHETDSFAFGSVDPVQVFVTDG